MLVQLKSYVLYTIFIINISVINIYSYFKSKNGLTTVTVSVDFLESKV